MDRKKPSLTSPWKVGFLVALLMVVTALGVGYLISGTFGVQWHFIHIGGLSPATWTFNLGAFLEEMAPLLLLTSLLAFASYVLVAGAVRRYKAYVDSGVEYKQLLKSIKSIEDLEDSTLVERLKPHPELREFLMSVRHRVAALERNHNGRERRPDHGERRDPSEERPRLPSESALLASAIRGGRDAFANQLALTVPELKQIERAMREFFAEAPPATVAAPQPASPATSPEMDRLRSTVRDTVEIMRRDLDECRSGARELETTLGALSETLAKEPAPASTTDTAAVQKRVDMTAEALAALGEETRRIAIASAMQASGGAEADDIKVADELRTLATRFNTVAQHWRETAPALRSALQPGAPAAKSGTQASAANAVARARLWSERMVAMTEQLRALERAVRDGETEPVAARRTAAVMDLADDTPAAATAPALDSDASEDFITRGNAETFGAADDGGASFADIPGFEKERRFFAETPVRAGEPGDGGFEVDRADDARWDLSSDGAEPVSEEPAAQPAAAGASDSDGFLTGPRPVLSPKKSEPPKKAEPPKRTGSPKETERAPASKTPRPMAPEPIAAAEPEVEAISATATIDADADAVDLYELGAVDCVQTG